jgi:hypothetical protein
VLTIHDLVGTTDEIKQLPERHELGPLPEVEGRNALLARSFDLVFDAHGPLARWLYFGTACLAQP